MRRARLVCLLGSCWLAACSQGSEGWVLQQRSAAAGVAGMGEELAPHDEGGEGGEAFAALPQAGQGGSAGQDGSAGLGSSGGSALAARCPTRFAAICSPALTVNNRDGAGSGALFTQAITDPSTTLSCVTRDVCDLLYRKTSEIRTTTKITLVIEDFAGVSETYHANGEATIRMSSRYLQKVADAHFDVGDTVRGLLYYHATNTYQFDGNDGFTNAWLVEGVADYVRHAAGYLSNSQRRPGGAYDDGGTTTGFFFIWLDEKYPDFVYELNSSLDPRRGVKWTPQAFEDITGQSVDRLWTAYQATF